MADVKYKPVRHDPARFLARARQRPGFSEAHEAVALEYALDDQMLKACARAGHTQDAVAERMGTTKECHFQTRVGGPARRDTTRDPCYTGYVLNGNTGPRHGQRHPIHR